MPNPPDPVLNIPSALRWCTCNTRVCAHASSVYPSPTSTQRSQLQRLAQVPPPHATESGLAPTISHSPGKPWLVPESALQRCR